MNSDSSSDSEFEVLESRSMIKKKKFKCKLGMSLKIKTFNNIF